MTEEVEVIPLVTHGRSDAVLTIEEAARYLKIGRTKMCALLRDGEVQSIEIGRLRRVPLRCLEDYISRLCTDDRAA